MTEAKLALALAILVGCAAFPHAAVAQTPGMADRAMSASMDDAMDATMMKHMVLTPRRNPTHADSVRAAKVTAEMRRAISKYTDTTAAVADGYHMFLPDLKTQHTYHFTNYARGILAAFHFNPAKPTSILYERNSKGKLELVGAMYTLPLTASLDALDSRMPLSMARWHRHVNWCVPTRREQSRWSEQKNGKPVFGPQSTIATKAECDAVHGTFYPSVFGWMTHVALR